MTTWNLGKTFPINNYERKPTLNQYIQDILESLIATFFIMDNSSGDSDLKTNSTHPVPAIRLGNCFFTIMTILKNPFNISYDNSIQIALKAYNNVKCLWEKLGLNARTFNNDIQTILNESANFIMNDPSIPFNYYIDNRLKKFGKSLSDYDKYAEFYKK